MPLGDPASATSAAVTATSPPRTTSRTEGLRLLGHVVSSLRRVRLRLGGSGRPRGAGVVNGGRGGGRDARSAGGGTRRCIQIRARAGARSRGRLGQAQQRAGYGSVQRRRRVGEGLRDGKPRSGGRRWRWR